MDSKPKSKPKIPLLPPLKLPHIFLHDDVCNTPSTDTGRHTIRYIATERTKKLYALLGINDGGHIYANMDIKLNDLAIHPEFKKLTSIERTDFCHHLLSFLQTEIDEIKPPSRVRRDVQMPKLKLTSKESNLYPIAKLFQKRRRQWKKWKQSWFERSIILTKFLVINNCDIKSLTPKLNEMDLSLEHILIYCIQHKTSDRILRELNHVDLTLKSIRSYRYPLTAGWLKRATPYIKPTLLHSLKKKETHKFLMERKRHHPFVKALRKKIKMRRKRSQKIGIDASLIIPLSTTITTIGEPVSTQTPLSTSSTSATFSSPTGNPYAGVVADAGSSTLKK